MLPMMRSVVVTPPAAPLFTLEEAKMRAGLDWLDGDARDPLLTDWITAATAKVQQDTGQLLQLQTVDVYVDAYPWASSIVLPVFPLVSVESIQYASGADLVAADPAGYTIDLPSARLLFGTLVAPWPNYTARIGQYIVRATGGYADATALRQSAPLLLHAVGLLVSHYANAGRDVVNVGHIVQEVPYGYDEAIAPHRLVVLP